MAQTGRVTSQLPRKYSVLGCREQLHSKFLSLTSALQQATLWPAHTLDTGVASGSRWPPYSCQVVERLLTPLTRYCKMSRHRHLVAGVGIGWDLNWVCAMRGSGWPLGLQIFGTVKSVGMSLGMGGDRSMSGRPGKAELGQSCIHSQGLQLYCRRLPGLSPWPWPVLLPLTSRLLPE